jgi:hypothetical protein
MDTFFAIPTSSQYTPLSPDSTIIIEDIVTPIIPRTSFSAYPYVYNNYRTNQNPLLASGLGVPNLYAPNLYAPTSTYYYDSGIGENPLAIHDTNKDIRYKFLDKWLFEDYPEIIRMLKISNSTVSVVSKSEVNTNDISKDSDSDLEKKSDYIGLNVLSLSKNKKILDTFCRKNNMKYYDIPHNEHFVKKAQAKYILKKLKEIQK